ncbi:MAG: hypothetical protein GKR90_15575 [Pseudomonadales bacterium]|nr:hypothetical protein [Pseudomonadales bacterium]
MTVFNAYSASIYAIGATAALMLIQLLVADVLGIIRKHTPGTSVQSGHSDPLFRVTRTVANTNESIGIFVCGYCFASLLPRPHS